jgi:hypothetical protein
MPHVGVCTNEKILLRDRFGHNLGEWGPIGTQCSSSQKRPEPVSSTSQQLPTVCKAGSLKEGISELSREQGMKYFNMQPTFCCEPSNQHFWKISALQNLSKMKMLINKAKFQTPYAIRRHSSCIISLGVMKM